VQVLACIFAIIWKVTTWFAWYDITENHHFYIAFMYKLEFYVPETHLDEVKSAVFQAGAGRIGNYDCCCWQTLGSGQFRPLAGSRPFLGQIDEIEKVPEWKVEMVFGEDYLMAVIEALESAHPYETPAYQYWMVQP